MECTLAALVACFNLSGLYIDSGLSWQDAGVYSQYRNAHSERIARDGLIESTQWVDTWRDHSAANPYGRVAIGYEVAFRQLTWRIEASHISSIETGQDRGVNAVSVSARWFPFGGRR